MKKNYNCPEVEVMKMMISRAICEESVFVPIEIDENLDVDPNTDGL